jgi:general secretion pathway protein L
MPADSPHADLVEGIDALLFAPALALALRFSGEAATQMNFRQGEYAYRQDLSQLFGRELRPTAILAATLAFLLVATAITTVLLQGRRAGRYERAAAALYQEAFPDQTSLPDDPPGALGDQLRAAQQRADFLGLYGGNRSALDLLAELSRAIPTDLEVRISEINIDRNAIRLDVDAQGFEAADRLTSVLSATEPFAGAKVAGSVKTDRRSGGVSFDVSIPLNIGGDEA